MPGTLVDIPVDPTPSRSGRTAFERNLLPGFAQWFIEELSRNPPDYLIPSETKGARILEAVIDYAQTVLGTPIRIPVLFASALAYIEPEILRDSRVMALDDAVRTGASLDRHRRWIERYEVRDISAVACVGQADKRAEPELARCYRVVDGDLYREYVWQLTELVVSRGLPPEVDHHVLRLTLPGRFPLAWERLSETLRQYGELSVDAGLAAHRGGAAMTLHSPILPGVPDPPLEGPARQEGARKLRFFADAATSTIYVVPVTFPALDLEPKTPPRLSESRSLELVRQWSGRQGTIGDLLMAEAHARDADTLFRALSSCSGLDLSCGLARLLGHTIGSDQVQLTAWRDPFRKLYGTRVGENVAQFVDAKLEAALGDPDAGTPREDAQLHHLGDEVVDTTRVIAECLKDLYNARARELGHEPRERVGWSLSEIEESMPSPSPLLASRCVDYGLAMTTLVPYTDPQTMPDGSVRVRRKYRVSEPNRDTHHQYEDRPLVRKQLSEETLALIADVLREQSTRYRGKPIPMGLLGHLTAILRPVLEKLDIPLHTRPGREGPVTVLVEGGPPATPVDGGLAFVHESDGIVPSPWFYEQSDRRLLKVDVQQSAERIEGYVERLLAAVDDASLESPELDQVLCAWAMSTDGRLGLTHVQHDLNAALDELEARTQVLRRGTQPEPSSGVALQPRARLDAARAKVQMLTGDWPARIAAHWAKPRRLEQQILDTVGAPTAPGAMYALAEALIDVVETLASVVERLDAEVVESWESRDDPASDALGTIAACCSALDLGLRSMQNEPAVSPTGQTTRQAADHTSDQVLGLTQLIRALSAALTGEFRGGHVGTRPEPSDDKRHRTVAVADLANSTTHGERHDFDEHHRWNKAGLDLLAQWGMAFGGVEENDRPGDAILLSFRDSPDGAVLCATAAQEHARVLRSTRIKAAHWAFHVAIDDGQVRGAEGPNVIGQCISRASKLANDETIGNTDCVLLTQTVADRCSPDLRALLRRCDHSVSLDNTEEALAHFVPMQADPEVVVAAFSEHLRGVAAATAEKLPQVGEPERITLTDAQLAALDATDIATESG